MYLRALLLNVAQNQQAAILKIEAQVSQIFFKTSCQAF